MISRRKLKMYTIGEVEKITGISKDRLRYYDKQGILKPRQTQGNQYRYYTIEDIIEVLSVEYFRQIDLGIKDIRAIYNGGDLAFLKRTVEEKRAQLMAEIQHMNQLANKLGETVKACEDITQYLNTFEIKPMPPFEVLGELSDSKAFVEYEGLLAQKESHTPIIKSMIREIVFSNQGIESNKMLIMRERDEAESSENTIDYSCCLYTIVEEKVVGKDIMPEVFEKCMVWVRERGYESLGKAFVKALFITYPLGQATTYLEIYAPIKKRT